MWIPLRGAVGLAKVPRLSQGQRRVGPPLVVAELDFEGLVIEKLDDGPHLTADEPVVGQVAEKGDDGRGLDVLLRHDWIPC